MRCDQMQNGDAGEQFRDRGAGALERSVDRRCNVICINRTTPLLDTHMNGRHTSGYSILSLAAQNLFTFSLFLIFFLAVHKKI